MKFKWRRPSIGEAALCGIAVALLYYLLTPIWIGSTEGYKFAIQQVRQSAEIKSKVGEVSEAILNWPFGTSWGLAGITREWVFGLQVRGPSGGAQIDILVEKDAGKWTTRTLVVDGKLIQGRTCAFPDQSGRCGSERAN